MNHPVPYVSVIKLNGQPILPPIVTPELKKQLQIYKQQAVRLEQRLKSCRELKRHLNELLEVPKINLSRDLIEVTQYNGSGVQTIASNVHLDDCDSTRGTKPRLIRSNSYTLDNPSPILLEHLKKLESASSPDQSARTVVEGVVSPPTIEVYQTDISVQQITVNTNGNSINGDTKKEVFFTKNPLAALEPDKELLEVLKDIPDVYANQIVDLLKKQHEEQKERLQRYDNKQENAIDQSEEESINLIDFNSFSDCPELTSRPQTAAETLRRSSTFSISPSQSLYYSAMSDSDTLVSGSTPKPTDIDTLLSLTSPKFNKSRVSKELFKPFDPIKAIRERAASIIGAHVRGYLIRRLLRTEKVQNLIATVKEVLVCAVELHNSKTIDEKDVELHRRLINQLSAALYSFHDIFFDLSTAEQMSIIAGDRERRRQKLKRPSSAKSLDLSSGRSSASSKPHKIASARV